MDITAELPTTEKFTRESSSPMLSLVTPMYNEANDITDNLNKIISALKALKITWELLLVDDGSNDDSLTKAKQVFAGESNCHIIHYLPNRGRGYALKQGINAARGDIVVTTESDLSWGPEIISKLFNTLRQTQCDMVIASVHLAGGRFENVPMFRRVLSSWGNKVMRWAFGGKITMLSGMTRAYRRTCIQSLQLEEDNKEIHLEIVIKALALRWQITEIPAVIRWASPAPGANKRGGFGILRFIFPHLMMSMQQASLRFLTWGMAFSGGLGILLIILGALNKIFHILPLPLPNLIIYGFSMSIISVIFLLFMVLSIQIRVLHQSVVHMQSQLKQIADSSPDEKNENTPVK